MFAIFSRISILVLIETTMLIVAVEFSDTHDYDRSGIRLASTNHFVVLAQNEASRFVIAMAPFGPQFGCSYFYPNRNNFVISIATGRSQNASQLSFVYFLTNSTMGTSQTLGIATISRMNRTEGNITFNSCNPRLRADEIYRPVKFWNREPSAMTTIQLDPQGNYAYGFLSSSIFIYDIQHSLVQDVDVSSVFSSVYVEPNALDIGTTNDRIPIAILAGYYQVDTERMLPIVYLIRLNPPWNMTQLDNYTLMTKDPKYVRRRDASSYQYDYVISVSIHDKLNRVVISVPYLKETFFFSYNRTNLQLLQVVKQPARSATWLNDDGNLIALLLGDISTYPWSQSRVEFVNTSSKEILYAYPNNQQTLKEWSNNPPKFLRLTKTNQDELAILTEDGTVVLVPSTEPGFYAESSIIFERKVSIPCPIGTYKSTKGLMPCVVCPTNTKSFQSNVSLVASEFGQSNIGLDRCVPCSNNSFCPLAAVADANRTILRKKSQAYAYPTSQRSSTFDDILMENTFNLQSTPARCLLISPFFWSLILLGVAAIILVIMGILYYSTTGKKYFHRLECIFRHSDLIGNGELWFGGLVSFAMIVLIVYSFFFGALFVTRYPMDSSKDADFACDTSLRNIQFSSTLQLLATIKSEEELPIFEMLNRQEFIMTVYFIQTGFNCNAIAAQENIGAYFVNIPTLNCSYDAKMAILIGEYRISSHQMSMQINLTGPYFVGGMTICLHGTGSISNSSTYKLQELDYCDSFFTDDQTLGKTVEIEFALTKVINKTEYLDYSGSNNYSGIWIPTSSHGSLNDQLTYLQRGPFLRYLSTQNTIFITFLETKFYMMNEEKPIARNGEILFHNILFTTTIIGLFALAFLIFKLTFMPIIQWFIRREISLVKFCEKRSDEQENKKNREQDKAVQNTIIRRF